MFPVKFYFMFFSHLINRGVENLQVTKVNGLAVRGFSKKSNKTKEKVVLMIATWSWIWYQEGNRD